MNRGLSALLAWAFNRIVKQDFLAGNRSYIAGFSAILGAVVLTLDMIVSGEFSEEKAGAAWAAFTLGQTIIGHAGKAEAQTKALKIAATKIAVAATVAADKVADAAQPPREH